MILGTVLVRFNEMIATGVGEILAGLTALGLFVLLLY